MKKYNSNIFNSIHAEWNFIVYRDKTEYLYFDYFLGVFIGYTCVYDVNIINKLKENENNE